MTDHGSIVTGAAAGLGGSILALLGADAGQLTAGFIGAIFGAGAAKTTVWWRGALLFVASVCFSAESASILGPVLDHLTDSVLPMVNADMASRFVALVTGALLHPTIQTAQTSAPAVVRGLVRFIPGAGGK